MMAEFTVCNLCEPPGRLDEASEVRQVRSNVREFRLETFTVWRCSQCQSLHSKEEVDLDRYYRRYPIHTHRLDDVTRLAYQNRLRSIQKCGVGRSVKILDYGCGHGVFVEFLRQSGFDATGYDAYVDAYSDKGALTASYDVITAYDVIEHVNEPRDLFYRLATYLKPGGVLVVGTPAADQIDLSDTESFLMELHQPYHRHILSETALLDQGAKAGLEVIRIDRRSYYDTPYPFLNTRFGKAYLRANDNNLDALLEQPRLNRIFASPRLLFYGMAGYFLPPPGNITVLFRAM